MKIKVIFTLIVAASTLACAANITKVIKLVAFIWVIVLLWKTTRQLEKMRKKVLSSPNSTSRN